MEYKFIYKVIKNNSFNIIIWYVVWICDVGIIYVFLFYVWYVMENGKVLYDWVIFN